MHSANAVFAITPWELPFVPLADGRRFPVRRIHCVGRNYAEHTREMGFDPDREAPFFFAKPADAVAHDGASIAYPRVTSNFAHEVELVVAIGRAGSDIPAASALDHVFGYAVGIDLTRRDLQLAMREKRRPWEAGKSFDQSAVIGPIVQAADIGHPASGRIWLTVNGEQRQSGDLSQLIWGVPDIIAFLSQLVDLEPGDVVMTGTPAGVGPLVPGDALRAGIEGVGELSMSVLARQ